MKRRSFFGSAAAMAASAVALSNVNPMLTEAKGKKDPKSVFQPTGEYDLVILQGTPAGIMCAIAAAKEGKTSLILERTYHIGGLPANGLGATDIETRGTAGGLFKEFVTRIKKFYKDTYGENSQQLKDCSEGFHFEPSVAATIFKDMLGEQKGITIKTGMQFNFNPDDIEIVNGVITKLRVVNRKTQKEEWFSGKVFIDASYEGDLIDAAGVPYFIGREAFNEYKEIGAGRIYKYWKGENGPGSTGKGDNAVQAYNYRVCLTRDTARKVEIKKPANYNEADYLSLIDDVATGRHTGVQMKDVATITLEANRKVAATGKTPDVPGTPKGIWRVVNMVKLPNGKTDSNNQHYAFLSTDLPEENWPYPTSSWEWRDNFAQRLRDYTLGLLWFAQNDPRLPDSFRTDCKLFGLAKDEYVDNDNFPRQIYVREGKRMKGKYLYKAQDALAADGKDGRPPIYADSITAGHYSLDSHAVRKREPNRVHLDGFFNIKAKQYTVPYRVMVPDAPIMNLLAPVPVSGTHVGFSTLRMEPCWMAFGEAAGLAASIAINSQTAVSDIETSALTKKMIESGLVLIWFNDVPADSPYFKGIQFAGVNSLETAWEFKPNDAADSSLIKSWCKKMKVKTPDSKTASGLTKGALADYIFKQYFGKS